MPSSTTRSATEAPPSGSQWHLLGTDWRHCSPDPRSPREGTRRRRAGGYGAGDQPRVHPQVGDWLRRQGDEGSSLWREVHQPLDAENLLHGEYICARKGRPSMDDESGGRASRRERSRGCGTSYRQRERGGKEGEEESERERRSKDKDRSRKRKRKRSSGGSSRKEKEKKKVSLRGEAKKDLKVIYGGTGIQTRTPASDASTQPKQQRRQRRRGTVPRPATRQRPRAKAPARRAWNCLPKTRRSGGLER